MYRVRSTDVWYNVPGIVCAYQPVAAPDAFAARQNVSSDARRAGVYMAVPGVLPTWASATGWTFDRALGQYLSMGAGLLLKPTTVLIRMTRAGSSFRGVLGGSANGCFAILVWNTNVLMFQTQYTLGIFTSSAAYPAAETTFAFSYSVTGVYAYYLNGLLTQSGTNDISVSRQTNRIGYSPDGTFTGKIAALAICNRTLSPAEIWLASRQMAYCNVNPDWSAWGRRRQYFYAPSQMAGFQAAWAARQNRLIGGGSS